MLSNKRTITFYFLVFLFLIDKLWVWWYFTSLYTDDDQLVFLNIAKDLCNGIIRTPCFWGQDYNLPIESWLAFPFIQAGMDIAAAVTLVSTIIGIMPILIGAYFLFYKIDKLTASIWLAFFLLLPFEYSVLITIPRGFTMGILLVSVAMYSYFASPTIGYIKGISILFLTCLGMYLVPNSVLLVGFVGVYTFYYKLYSIDTKKIAISLVGVLPVVALVVGIKYYYRLHPSYTIHHASYGWELASIVSNIKNARNWFLGFAPFIYQAGSSVAVMGIGLLIYYYRQKSKMYNVLLLTSVAGFALLISNKLTDGTASVLYGYNRFFMAIPLIVYALISNLELWKNKMASTTLITIAVAFTGYKIVSIPSSIQKVIHDNSGIVDIVKLDNLHTDIVTITDYCKQQDIQWIVLGECNTTPLNYAIDYWNIPAIHTIYPCYERRHWIREKANTVKNQKLLLIDVPNKPEYTYVKNWQSIALHKSFSMHTYTLKNTTLADFCVPIHSNYKKH